jgi:tetratricopeptide (TPR) repeat protein
MRASHPRMLIDELLPRLLLLDDARARAAVLATELSGLDAADLAANLKAVAERELHRDAARSRDIGRLIEEVGAVAGDHSLVALGMMTRADALREMGRYIDAVAAYDAAAIAFEQIDDEVGWARTRIGATLTSRYTGHGARVVADAERARAILAHHGIWLRLARLESAVGTLLCEQGRVQEALDCFDRALAAAQRLDPPDESLQAEILGNRATAHLRLDERGEAERLLALAGELFERQGNIAPLAATQLNRGFVLVDQGQYSKALAAVTTARRAFVELGRPALAAMAGELGSDCLLRLNRPVEAATLAAQVSIEFEALGAMVELAKARMLRGVALARLEDRETALHDLAQAETLFDGASCDGWRAFARLQRALVLADAEDWEAARVEAIAAGNELEREGRVVAAAQCELVRARALRALGKPEEADAIARYSLEHVGTRGAPLLAYQTWYLLGDLALDTDRPRAALDAFDAAVRALEELQGGILTEYRASFLEHKLGVYEHAARLCLELGDARRAFEYAERAKSRALVDALAGGVDIRLRAETPRQQELVHQFNELRRRHDRLAAALFRPDFGGQPTPASGPQDEDVQRRELVECEQRIAITLEELHLEGSADLERLALLQGQSYPVQPLLSRDTLLLEYFALGDEDVALFLVTANDVQATVLPGVMPRVEGALRLLELNLTATADAVGRSAPLHGLERNARGILGRLHELLLGPVVERTKAFERLLIVPHGPLHQLPLAALYGGCDGYLVQSHEVVIAPSTSALFFCLRPRRRGGQHALVVAHSAGGHLPGTVAEAAVVADLFPGKQLVEQDATVTNFQQLAGHADLIHLAAHGECRTDAPLFSYLRLEDGQLTALDCLNLDLDCALVTLAACESGRGILAPGDEPIGLSRALLYAGARSVLQTLWQVDDQQTSGLMDGIYRGLRAGLGRGAAVRAAQRMLLERGGIGAHPYFWAPLVLVGDWRPLGPAPQASAD